jgi:predicted metal-binding protein
MKKNKNLASKGTIFRKLSYLYTQMEKAYNETARQIGLSCSDCSDNCCVSYFQHHTYVEWAYLWQGLQKLTTDQQETIIRKAENYVQQSRFMLAHGQHPQIMCPLNEKGLCTLYDYRLMICRLHGVPNTLRLPNGSSRDFPGCHLCQGLSQQFANPPTLDRTRFYKQLAELEMNFIGSKKGQLPKVDMTLAEMIAYGPPKL